MCSMYKRNKILCSEVICSICSEEVDDTLKKGCSAKNYRVANCRGGCKNKMCLKNFTESDDEDIKIIKQKSEQTTKQTRIANFFWWERNCNKEKIKTP